jgi:hypothetical protein
LDLGRTTPHIQQPSRSGLGLLHDRINDTVTRCTPTKCHVFPHRSAASHPTYDAPAGLVADDTTRNWPGVSVVTTRHPSARRDATAVPGGTTRAPSSFARLLPPPISLRTHFLSHASVRGCADSSPRLIVAEVLLRGPSSAARAKQRGADRFPHPLGKCRCGRRKRGCLRPRTVEEEEGEGEGVRALAGGAGSILGGSSGSRRRSRRRRRW